MDVRRHPVDSLLAFLRAQGLPLPASAAAPPAPGPMAVLQGPSGPGAPVEPPTPPAIEELQRRSLLAALAAQGHIALGHES
eukprot:1875430-Alexandrium_andersonii.AAC.1